MPHSISPLTSGFLGFNPDPTPNAQYTDPLEATRAVPEASGAAFRAVRDYLGGRKTSKFSRWAYVVIPAVAVGSDLDTPFGSGSGAGDQAQSRASFFERPGTVVVAVFIPAGNLTGQATNNRTWSLINKGQADAGNVSMGAGFSSTAGNNLVQDAETALVLTGATFIAGDRLYVRSLHVGTGQADPGGLVAIRVDLT